MSLLKQSPQTSNKANGWAVLGLGFRPFFLLAGCAAVLMMALWPLVWRGQVAVAVHYDPIAWHAHEMLFGYVAAVIAGFLLTAVRNWSGAETWTGSRLGLLALLWLCGRVLPWLPGVPVALVVAVDVAFLPLLALSLVPALWQGSSRVNRLLVPLILAMGLVNLLSHLQMLGVLDLAGDMRRVMPALILLLLVMIAGRVVPFFAANVLPGFTPTVRPWVERLTPASLGLIALFTAWPVAPSGLLAALWSLFALAQAVRLAGWFDRRVFSIAILWILYLGYAWLVVGAFLNALAAVGLFPPSAALHALTVGTIGSFTIGMMARVARGHTGRPIDVGWSMALAFVVVNLAVLVRVFGTALFSSHYALWIDLSATLWVTGFALFTAHYLPMLLRPRVDGKPG